MLKPTQREDMLSELAAGNKGPIIKSFKEYESQRKRETYWRSKGLHEELYSNTHSLVDNEYKAIKELVEIGTETPASDKLWLSGLSRVLPPETVRKIIDEKMKKLKGLSLLRNDIENDREILEKIFSEP